MSKQRWYPPATEFVEYEDGCLFFNCDHELQPKTIGNGVNPIKANSTCDNWSPKNDNTKYVPEDYPRVCFNCFHSVAIEIKEKDRL